MSDVEQVHDNEAERAVLAACLYSKLARDEARRHLVGADFHQPIHESIWRAMSFLDARAEPVDPTTVLERIRREPRATDVLPGLVTHPAVPDHVGTYAETVRGWSTKRSLAAAARQVLHRAMSPDADPATYAAQVANEFAAIRDAGATEDIAARTLTEILADPEDEPDWLIPGYLERRDRLMLTGDEGTGKALAVDTPIPTPNGWTTMGELRTGDYVFGPDGTATQVIATTEHMQDRPCYRLTFSDGATIVADAQHLWLTEDYYARVSAGRAARRGNLKLRGTDQSHKRTVPSVRTTEEIAGTLYARGGFTLNHSIPMTAPLRFAPRFLLIDPYVLGAWLGDGTSTAGAITTHPDDAEILTRIAETWPVRKAKAPYLWMLGDGSGKGKRGTATFAGCLRELGVFGNKHIPEDYLTASVSQRIAILQGLMDTDGSVTWGGSKRTATCEFSVTSERLARDVHRLLLELGIKVRWCEGDAILKGRRVGTRYRLAFQTDLPVFHLQRKAERLEPLRTARAKRRYITACDPVGPVPVRCIQVDREDGLFLAGRECITTHNSFLMRQFALCAAAGLDPFDTVRNSEPRRILIVDCENTENQVRRATRGIARHVTHYGAPDALDRVLVHNSRRLDVTREKDLATIHREADAWQPDLMVIGPLYRLVPRAIQTDDDAAPVLAALDTFRDRDIALLIEAHSGHALGKGGKRDMRPRGSSALLGWPEFGYGMRDLGLQGRTHVQFAAWRGDRSERQWPTALRRERDGTRWLPYDGPTDVPDSAWE